MAPAISSRQDGEGVIKYEAPTLSLLELLLLPNYVQAVQIVLIVYLTLVPAT